MSSDEAGSSWPGADDTTRPDDTTVAEARPPGIAEHSVMCVVLAHAESIST